jgi:hypothetical protein
MGMVISVYGIEEINHLFCLFSYNYVFYKLSLGDRSLVRAKENNKYSNLFDVVP